MVDKKSKPDAARGATLFGKSDKRKKSTNKYKNSIYKPKEYKDQEFIKKIIYLLKANGIIVEGYKEAYITRRLHSRLLRLEFDSYKQYYRYLKKNKAEMNILQKNLSINVTRFFRNRETFTFLKEKVIPVLISNSSKSLKFWSAGCAVGPEPYSIAMIMYQNNRRYSLLATDLKIELLNLAKKGIYDNAYLAELKESEKLNYFNKIDEITYSVKNELKSNINFEKLDLLSDIYPTNMDMILCRNVLIYFDREYQKQMIPKFIQSLNIGGFLILGQTESISNHHYMREIKSYDTKHRVYQRIK